MKIISVIFALLFSCSVAQAINYNGLDTQYGSTADKLYLSSFSVDYVFDKNNLTWPYKHESSRRSEWGINAKFLNLSSPGIKFKSTALSFHGSYKIDENQKLSGLTGFNYIDQENGRTETVDLAQLKYEFFFFEQLMGSIMFAQTYDVPIILPLNGRATNVASTNIQAQLGYQFLEKWQLDLKTRFDFLFDKNQRNWFDAQVMYALSKYPEWIRFGFGTTYLSYQKNSPNYWTPRRLSSYGPRLDFNIPLLDKVQFFAGGSYNWFQEDAFTPGEGFYARGGLSYGHRDSCLVTLAFESGESTQNDNLWYNQFASLNAHFFW